MRRNKALVTTALVLTVAGGLQHALQGFLGTDLLGSILGSYATLVQGIAGVGTLVYVWMKK